MESIKKPKTITLSFNIDDTCIVLNDEPPRTNSFNGTIVDLTEDSDKDEDICIIEKEAPVIPKTNTQTAKAIKTIEFNMSVGSCVTKSEKPKESFYVKPHDFNNNPCKDEQPTCSKRLSIDHLLDTQKDLYDNTEDFICSLCLNFVFKGCGVALKACMHTFCRQCLVKAIHNKHDEMTGSVKCPFEAEICDNDLNEKEIKELLGASYEVFQEQIKYNVEQFLENEARKKEESRSESLIPALLGMDLDFIPNMKPFECQVCFDQVEVGNGITLHNCLHEFCKDCLSGQIEAAEEFEVKCPLHDMSCKEYLKEREVKALVSVEIFDKHLQKALKVAEHGNELAFHCRTPDCPIFMEIADEVTSFQCPTCKKVNCIKCKAIHEGKTCLDYQEEINPQMKTDRLHSENFQSEDAIKQLIATNQAMYCPKCNIPVMKVSGCDFISCCACKLGICWVTKKPRNDLQKADGTIIQGCRCKAAPTFKPCHPNCGNCH
ncbi:ranBP-type and C3HC4-type zinc finger-containing protein 1-like [Chironomus tepperi]|uniref:ranBP-type and C3HC4-type zinc finger-containing protein 1-like n=1 Tax=Chironomus tepperi TaxID=113505 RepID=UPI00391F9879